MPNNLKQHFPMIRERDKVLSVLPTESVRLADETSLVMMDIVVELEDGSIANVEMQDTIDAQKRLIEKSIADMIQMMRQLGKSEDDIRKKIQEQYQLEDDKIQKYL